MGFKDLKLKVLRVKKFLTRRNDQISSSWKYEPANKQPWVLTSISHGFHTFEGNRSSMMHGSDESGESSSDLVMAQREQIQNSEVWMFGLFDRQIGDGVTKYLQSNLFDKKLSKGQIKRRAKETIKKAYVSSKAKISGEGGGSTSAIVINGKKIVAADIGDYRTVLCKDGVAHRVCKRSNRKARRCLSLTIHSGIFRRRSKHFKPSTPEFGIKRIDSKTDFLILASNGIWEVMRSQEAVDLISHIDDPQEAAECLAKEAVTRLAKANISCLVVRFD